MTPEQQRIAIAAACGWRFCPEQDAYVNGYYQALPEQWFNPEGEPVGSCLVPDYLNDLNAMHEAEKTLTPAQCVTYAERLAIFKCMWLDQPIEGPQSFIWGATAAQRAEAFLRTLGLWKEVQP